MQKEDLEHLLDEMIEIEKEIQGENVRRAAAEEQFFEALGRCDFGRANELLASMDDSIALEFQARFDKLKEKAKALTRGGNGEC